ncbi:MAG: histidinol-phosphate aminotransferase [Harvfovirus sp.]|uniref:histidinol-phosphate transaminase n=1 Tax=Harvfovirus sp. TaxID=2487768 RepID=A0A3G5A3P1_9VIRU|nr:MAG: histidinol-phosphate aminotransferase [Harvfovirus sp.]
MEINKNIIGKHQYTLPYAPKYRYKLDVIENFWETHPDVKKAIGDAIDGKIHQYPYQDDTYFELLERIARYTNVSPHNIILTNGSDSALKLLLEAYVTSETNTLIILPTYPHFISFIENVYHGDIDYLNIHLNDTEESITSAIANKLALKQYNLCYICSPNLPLGYMLHNCSIVKLLKSFEKTMFIIDEAYYEYPIPDEVMTSASELIEEYHNLSVTRTFSKAFGLASLRLGYLISNKDNIDLVRVLSNDKNVTTISIYAGNAALRNLDYYQKCALEVQQLKKYVAKSLDKVISVDDEIFGYNVGGGNFFLLLARNPTRVVSIFKDHGIYIRNKHDDVPNAIRITMGTEKMMNDVLFLCKWINIKSQLQKSSVVFDLDMTIRNGSKLSSEAFDGILLLNQLDSYLCTSNGSQSIEEISCWLKSFSVNLDRKKIINPVRMVVNYLERHSYMRECLVVGPKSVTDELKLLCEDRITSVFDMNYKRKKNPDMVVYTGMPALGSDQVARVCEYVNQGAILGYTDSSVGCDLSNCADIEMMGDALMPDVGAYMKMFEMCGYKPINIGKQHMLDYWKFDKNIQFVVGDSIISDGGLAEALAATFIYVDANSKTSFVDFDNNRIVIPSIKRLKF